LWGRSILFVEDELLVALDVHRALSEAGASVIAATTVDDALDLITYADISAAIVEVNLGLCDCSPVCQALSGRKIPFILYTGYTDPRLPDAYMAVPVITKPAAMEQVIAGVADLVHPSSLDHVSTP
jgi:DNA-binding response OmpR family regulator